jgi:hypothetical protein
MVTASAEQVLYDNKPTPWWPCWRYVRLPRERWWEDRQEFEGALIDAIVNAWDDLASLVAQAMAEG